MGISVLGPLTVDDSATRMGPRETLVLAALTMRVGEVVSADQLADAVWGAAPPASWHKNLQTCIVRLRKTLGAGAIETAGHGYRLTLPADAVDARRFEGLVVRGRELSVLGEPEPPSPAHQSVWFRYIRFKRSSGELLDSITVENNQAYPSTAYDSPSLRSESVPGL